MRTKEYVKYMQKDKGSFGASRKKGGGGGGGYRLAWNQNGEESVARTKVHGR